MADKNMEIWDALRTPPESALKTIGGGRLKGMTDISPQWRYQAMTEQFGPCGVGWSYEVTNKWLEPGSGGEIAAFADVLLYINDGGEWSRGIPGSGGSMYVTNEHDGPHTSDEAYKMAVTDALSVAMKQLGVAADIYMGTSGTKYSHPIPTKQGASQKYNRDEPIGFGKHRGTKWRDLPDDYLEWLSRDGNERSKVWADQELGLRKNASAEQMPGDVPDYTDPENDLPF